MADKCWFVLKQTHYPPPAFPINGAGSVSGSGPLCWGHIIPSITKLDNVINPRGPPDITPDIRIYHTKSLNLTWDASTRNERSTSSQFSLPVGVGIGMRIGADLGASFQQTVKTFWQFESLDSYIFQPTLEYVEDAMESDEVQAYLKRRGGIISTSLFMITGIIVARGGEGLVSVMQNKNPHGGPKVDMASVVKLGFDASTSNTASNSVSTEKATDFVWAIRLAKISKEGVFDRRWSCSTLTKGATFSSNCKISKRQELFEALENEGFVGAQPSDLDIDGDIYVVDMDGACHAT
ncbi:unnamed protein product [Clonostachys solani]|uniref:Uncharacterized protein n=1 Tax=Clonostachys solani TaxID=160281 RepID=A0A9N9ZGH3_9HYPO|nr:unnamed protein product [Clonostachys solani]